MAVFLYNSLSRSKEPLDRHLHLPNKQLGMYVCGPTVYDDSHIGHARSAFTFELIRSYLAHRDYDVFFVRNVTDVDDKIIEKARKETGDLKQATRQISERYLTLYHDEMGKLGIESLSPKQEPRATGYIRQMQAMIQEIVQKGAAYVAGGDVYFDITRAKGYGKLSRQSPEQMLEGVRQEPAGNKRNPLDFALWKAAKPEEPSWDSPWGAGRPGWHIECSTMSTDIFQEKGYPFVIHGGGLDLIFPHHENETAQAEAAGRPFATLWVHNGLVTVNGQKMSKSLGNFITLRELFEKASPEVIRFYFLQTHYRSPLDFSWEKLEEAKAAYERFHILFGRMKLLEEARRRVSAPKAGGITQTTFNEFYMAMDDDLNTSEALAVLFKLLNHANWILDDPNRTVEEKACEFAVALHDLRELGKILMLTFEESAAELSPEEEDLIRRRDEARKRKDFKMADTIRRQLSEKGLILEDAGERTLWRRAR